MGIHTEATRMNGSRLAHDNTQRNTPIPNFPSGPPPFVDGALLMEVSLRLTEPRPESATTVNREDTKAVKHERK